MSDAIVIRGRVACPESIDPKQGVTSVDPEGRIEYIREAAHKNAGCKTCHGSGWIVPVANDNATGE